MAIYAILAAGGNDALRDRIESLFPDDSYTVADAQWLISADLTTNQLAEKLEISGGRIGSALVLRVTTYYGWHDPEIWDWLELKTKAERST